MTNGCDLSVVIPTYNERERLEELIAGVTAVLGRARIRGEMVVVDDNSPDGTGEVAEQLSGRYALQVVHREGKLGLGSAVIAGFERARASVLGVMDADLSHPPSILPGMLAALRELGVDAVVGSRYVAGGGSTNWPFLRFVMSRSACLLARPLTPVRDATSGLFLMRREAVQDVSISAAGFKICLELLTRGRIGSIAEVPYVFANRTAGESKMTLREAAGYFVQLRDLYALRRGGRRRPPVRHVIVSESALRDLQQAAFGQPRTDRSS